MKTLLVLLLLSASICSSVAQTNAPAPVPASTNNVTVVLDTYQDALLRSAWKLDNEMRTNSLPPYTNSLPSQNYKTFLEGLAPEALAEKAVRITRKRETDMRRSWQNANEAKRTKALKALRE